MSRKSPRPRRRGGMSLVAIALAMIMTIPGAEFVLAPGGSASALIAQTLPCGCADLFDELTANVETNYPGFHLELRDPESVAAHERHLSDRREEASAASDALACVTVLQTYVAWFRDGHLFVGGRPAIRTAADSAGLRAAAPRVDVSRDEFMAYLAGSSPNLDPVEGMWTDPAGMKLAIIREGEGARSALLAVVLESSTDAWQPGDVRARLTALSDGSYDAVLYDDQRALTRLHVWTRGLSGGARLQRDGQILHMPPVTWGKLHPVRPGTQGRIDPIQPRAPTARLTAGGSVVVFHVPSFVPAQADRLEALVDQYRGALEHARTLIIDLRGNEGGSTFVGNPLMPWLATADKRPGRYLAEGASAVLASSDNVSYFERTGWAPTGLVARLRQAEPGSVVPFADPATAPPEPQAETAGSEVTTPRPQHVAILTDRMTVSAAEAFILRAMRNRKVTLFGEPTGSSIDYQNVGIVPRLRHPLD